MYLGSATTFRSDIEGLRAVAVLLVIAAHYEIPGLTAGFIGVDLFFVISGYLITRILVREHEETGRIHLLRFYTNRLRRLLPALVTMLVASAAAAWWLLPPGQQASASMGAASAALWISNIYFAFSEVDYFAAQTSTNMFLHTWSLGVEEQFYLVWPLLIFFALPGTLGPRKRLLWICVTIAIASLGLCLALAQEHPMLAYYLMPTRAWQFAAGAIAWWASSQYPVSSKQAKRSGWLGLALLAIACAVIDPNSTYPNSSALLPTLAGCLILWGGSGQLKTSVTNILSFTGIQRIGNLSYSLYLWHWPIWIIIQHLSPETSIRNISLSLVSTFFLSYLTYFAIENPIRFGSPAKWRLFWQIGLALPIMTLVSSQMLRWNEDINDFLYQEATVNSKEKNITYASRIYADGCDDWYKSDTLKLCTYGNIDAKNTAVLLGDSIGAQWFPTLSAIYIDPSWKIVVLTKSSCPIVDEPYFYKNIGREYTECGTWRQRAIDWLKKNKTKAVFIGSTASSNFTEQQWEQGSLRIFNAIAPYTDAIYLIESNPTLPFDALECLRQKISEQCKSTESNPDFEKVARALKRAIAQQPNAHWIETASFVCPDKVCQALRVIEDTEIVVYRDSQHLTATFAATVYRNFEKQIKSKND